MIPIFRAEKLENDEHIIGSLSTGSVGSYISHDNRCTAISYEIKEETLEISFDNGISFDSVDDIADIFCDYTPKEVRYKLGF